MNAIKKSRKQQGTSLIELMIAMLVLGVGLLGSAAMTAVSINTNIRSKNDSTSTAVAQAVIGQISAIPIGTTTATVTDSCQINSTINTTGTSIGAGAPLTANGIIDFTQSYTGVPAGYGMRYSVCNNLNGTRAVYDVRWNVATTANGKEELVVVGARFIGTSASGNAQSYARAVNLRTVVGNQGE
jgi:prepilin-type N-terminal cleavage/methylation domain-containing protein